ncbi:MAG: hypothetical protein IT233_12550 [Bacteroidia bacterium]|nr:hypothetical protein [Bacteroidia bacterium]
MKVTKNNFMTEVHKIGQENLPEGLLQAHLYLMKMTDGGKDWSLLEKKANFKRLAELAFQKLEEFLENGASLNGKPEKTAAERLAKNDALMYVYMELDQLQRIYELEKMAEEEDGLTPEIKIRKRALEKEIRLRKKDLKGKGLSGKPDTDVEMSFIKRFLYFNRRKISRDDMTHYVEDLQEAIKGREIRKTSLYAAEIRRIQDAVVDLYNSRRKSFRFQIDEYFTYDLERIVERYEKSRKISKKDGKAESVPLCGPSEPVAEEPKIMSSIEFAKKEFKTLGFTGKWLELIGDPSQGFTAMVFGKPKMGKSFLCIDFAGYLARNFGKVLYVAKEEKLDLTLQQKLKEKDVAHENLFVSDHLPEDLSGYDFIFLDSVNLLGLNPAALRALKEANPGKSFIYIFQTTKTGNFRGANSFQHDVDVVIDIPEKGKAVQFGRFNQGGEMGFFESSEPIS